jgi:hypothetical protein
MKASKILTNAAELIETRGVERDKEDGERSMERCVKSFNEMTSHNLTETEGWKFMMFLKMARMEGGAFKLDDYEDNVSYAALMAEAAVKEEECTNTFCLPEDFDDILRYRNTFITGNREDLLGGPDAFSPLIGGCTEPPRETCVDKAPEPIVYDDYGICPACGHENAISIKDRTDGVPSEVGTRCRKCSHLDYWAFGHYEIGAKGQPDPETNSGV